MSRTLRLGLGVRLSELQADLLWCVIRRELVRPMSLGSLAGTGWGPSLRVLLRRRLVWLTASSTRPHIRSTKLGRQVSP